MLGYGSITVRNTNSYVPLCILISSEKCVAYRTYDNITHPQKNVRRDFSHICSRQLLFVYTYTADGFDRFTQEVVTRFMIFFLYIPKLSKPPAGRWQREKLHIF